MKTYILNLYYPKLSDHAASVRMAKAFVENNAGKSNYRVIRASEFLCSIAFTTSADPKRFQDGLMDIGRDQFQYLLLEISGVHAGWTDKSVYEWLRGHLPRG